MGVISRIRTYFRSAKTGLYLSRAEAEENPDTSFKERRRISFAEESDPGECPAPDPELSEIVDRIVRDDEG